MPVLLSLCTLYIVIGYILSKRVNTASDFLVAGRSLPVIVVSFTIAATHFGGGVFVGGIEWGVEKGVWPGAYAGIGLGLTCLLSAFIAGKFRSIDDGITPPDFIEHRYGHSKFLRGYHAIVYILGTVAIIACQFMAFGSMASAFGISYKSAVLLGTVVVIIYTYMAGMWGVAITDFIQLGMCIVFIPIIAVLGGQIIAAEHSVTIGDLLSQPFFPQADSMNDFLYTSLPSVLGSLFAYEYFIRWQSSRNAKDAKNSCFYAGIILIVLSIPIGIISGIGKLMYPTTPAGEVLGKVITSTLPGWAGVLFLAAVLSAIMSTADSLMTSLGGMVTRDLYHKVFNHEKKFNELKNVLLYTKLTAVVGSIGGCIVALNFRSILGALFWMSPLQGGALFAPVVIGLFWKGANRSGAFAAVITGGSMALVDMIGLYSWPERMLFPILGSAIALVVVSLVTKNKEQNNLEAVN
jgi:Na+/proline symporter